MRVLSINALLVCVACGEAPATVEGDAVETLRICAADGLREPMARAASRWSPAIGVPMTVTGACVGGEHVRAAFEPPLVAEHIAEIEVAGPDVGRLRVRPDYAGYYRLEGTMLHELGHFIGPPGAPHHGGRGVMAGAASAGGYRVYAITDDDLRLLCAPGGRVPCLVWAAEG